MKLRTFRASPLAALAAAFLLSPPEARAQEAQTSAVNAPVATLRAARRNGPIVLDGRLDDAAWQAAPVASDFTQSWPNPGKAPVDPTEVRVLYDAEAIYVGVRMFDSHPDSIAAPLARRDAGGIYSDWVHLIIDSYHDRRTAFRFTTNPKGVQKDVFTSNDGNEDANWDAVWEVSARVDSAGWVAEYRIPLSQLRFGGAAAGRERVWGFQVMRDVARRDERSSWSPWKQDGRGFVSKFGDLTGLADLRQPRRLEVIPYVSAKATRAPGNTANPFYKQTDTDPNAGADVRYGLPGGLTLTATINPDFGQVEVDPAVVNLSAYETFFPEKRPFFLEGSDIFSFGQVRRNNDYGSQTFFYTRRIGRAPTRSPSGAGIAFVDSPGQTRIASAAKVTGKKGPWTIGLLDAVTSEERASVAGPSGAIDSTTAVEPRANYLAGRVRRDFRKGQTVMGGMLTLLNRDQSPLFANLMSARAGFAGFDVEHRWENGKYILSGFSMGSRVDGSSTVINSLQRNSSRYLQRPDATSLAYDATRTSLTGRYEEIAFSQTGTWFGSLAIKEVTPGFEINDVGFQSRVDYRSVSPFYGYQTSKADRWSRNKFAGIWSNHTWNFDGTSIYQSVGGSANTTFTNFWSAGLNGNASVRYFSDRLLRGGPLALLPAQQYLGAWINSDTRRKVWFNPYVNYTRYSGDDAWSANGGVYMETRPTTTLRVTVGPNYSKQLSTSQYVRTVSDALAGATYGARYVFANLDQTTLSMDTRINWTLTSRLSLQSYFQPFVAIGRYQGFKEFSTPRRYDFAVYGRDRGTIAATTSAQGAVTGYAVDPDGAGAAVPFTIGNPNFNSHSLRGNAVLRWEYRPGSSLYFVWQQQRSGAESAYTFDAQRDVGAIFRDRPTNIFLIKAAYWLSR
jgi:Domain of unknown function (DUF5916)/Carbohydrate family 9 binding domain-like